MFSSVLEFPAMKYLRALLVFISVSTLVRGADVPPEIAEARKRYEAAMAVALAPVRDRYVQELQQLKSRAMSLKNLDLAIALDNEIKNVAPLDGNMRLGLEKRLIGTTWLWDNSETRLPNLNSNKFTFLEHGITSTTLTWKVKEPVTVVYTFPKGNHGTITFESDFTRGIIHEIRTDGGKVEMPITRAKE
jgi:hypothetical protein